MRGLPRMERETRSPGDVTSFVGFGLVRRRDGRDVVECREGMPGRETGKVEICSHVRKKLKLMSKSKSNKMPEVRSQKWKRI